MRTCPVCRSLYSEQTKFCPKDGTPLVVAAAADPHASLRPAPVADSAPAGPRAPEAPPDDSAGKARARTLLYGRAALEQRSEDLRDFAPRQGEPVGPAAPALAGRLPTPPPRPAEDEDGATRLTSVEDAQPPDDDQTEYLGKIIDGRYQVKSLIGRGGMGTVFCVEQIHLRKRMAMKLLHENLVGRKQLVSRFTREARAISRLSSPHTVMVYDFGRWNEVFYLVMELLEGEPLDSILGREDRLSPERALHILLQMCDSLAEAHKHGIVHRDLKPENVMLIRGAPHADFVKILDFGLAKVKGVDDPYTIHSQKDIFGTPFYMSPEQIRAGEVDHRADIYAVGALAFRMLTGRQVFGDEKNTFDILKAHLMKPAPRMRTVVPDLGVPVALEAIVARLLEKDPARRFQSMDELCLALVEAKKAGLAPTPPGSPAEGEAAPLPAETAEVEAALVNEAQLASEARRHRRRRLAGFGAGLLVALAAAGLAVWNLSGGAQGAEIEPNDTPAQANSLGADLQATGFIGQRRSSHAGDRDCFRLPAVGASEDVAISLRGLPTMDIQFTLHDSRGRQLFVVNARGRGEGELLRHPGRIAEGSVLCLCERLVEGQVAGEAPSDRYDLRVEVRPRLGHTESEPNDSGRGNVLPAEAAYSGALAGAQDRDVFALDGQFEGKVVRVSLEAPEVPLTGVRMTLQDADGTPLASHLVRPRQTGGSIALAAVPPQMPESLLLQVVDPTATAVASAPLGLAYRIRFAVEDLGDQQEIEPNNTAESAFALVLGAWHSGSADDSARVDWLRIDGSDTAVRRLLLEANAPSGSSFWLTVRDQQSGTDLRRVEVSAERNDQVLQVDSGAGGLLVRVEPSSPVGSRRPLRAAYRLRARWGLPAVR